MIFKKLNFKINSPSTGLGLMILAFTQIPLAVNETLKVGCVLTTWSDYAVFWNWKDIPLDARVRYCQGGSNPKSLMNPPALSSKGNNAL